MIFLSLIALIWLFFGRENKRENIDQLTGVYFDNSVSSVLGDADISVEKGLKQLSNEVGSFLLFSNSDKTFISKDAVISITEDKTRYSTDAKNIFKNFDDNGVTSHYFFSDFQVTDLAELSTYMADSSKDYQIILTNELSKARNVSVDTLLLIPNEANLSELSILVEFDVFNMSGGSIVVKLVKGSRQLSSIVKDVVELDKVQFDIAKDNYGEFDIVIDGDDVSFDNTFHFTIGEKVKPRIIIIESDRSRIIKEVFANQELFDVVYQDIGNLDFEIFEDSDLVIISDQFKLPESLQYKLENTNYLLFPSDSVDIDSYERFIGVNLSIAKEVVLETSVDSNHPILKGVFEERIKGGSMPFETPMFKINGEFEPVLDFRGGNTFLLKKNGVYFFNSSLKGQTGGFQSHALFLPLLYQIAFTASGSLETPYYYPGDRLIVSTAPSDVPIKLIKDNYEIIPSFNSGGAQMILELPEDLEPGKYFLTQNADTLLNVAVNVPKEESIMRAPSLEEMKQTFDGFKNVRVSEIVDGNENAIITAGSKSSIWKYALILTVFLLLTETVLHRYLR